MNQSLNDAVLTGNINSVNLLLLEGCDAERTDTYGRTPPYYAISKDYGAIVSSLIKYNVNVNHQDKDGKSPLHFAAIHNRSDIAKLLLESGAEINCIDSNGNVPLFDAIFNCKGDVQILQIFLEYNADYMIKNNHGVSPKNLAHNIANYSVSQLFQ